jgi:hypothetical protein
VAPTGLADDAGERTVQTLNWARKRGRFPELKTFIKPNKHGLLAALLLR